MSDTPTRAELLVAAALHHYHPAALEDQVVNLRSRLDPDDCDLRVARARALLGSEWRPIETAPKDGTTIEWTDAACRKACEGWKASRYAAYDHRAWRDGLDAATAEQFKPETAEEKVKRLEAALIRLRDRSVPGSEFDRIITEALAGPNSKET